MIEENKEDDEMKEDSDLGRDEKISAAAIIIVLLSVLLIIVVRKTSSRDLVAALAALGNIGLFGISLMGACASVWWWSQRRPRNPRVKVEQTVRVLPFEDGRKLLYVSARLHNVGELPIVVEKWCLWATQVQPFHEAVMSQVSGNGGNACRDFQMPWPRLAGAEFEMASGVAARIFPGEDQQLCAMLLIESQAQVVRLYSFFPHKDLNLGPTENRGWQNITLINLTTQEVAA